MLGDRQRRQIDIQPQPICGQVVPQAQTLTAQQSFAAGAQLFDLHGTKGIERASDRRLIRKLLAPPGVRQRQIGPQPAIDLRNGSATGE